MKILGIDPGTRIAGYGLIEKKGPGITVIEYGSIKTDKSHNFPQRLKFIHYKIMDIISKHQPDQMATEEIFYGKNNAATVVKKAVVGNGNAHKGQVQEMVKIILGLSETPKPDDVSDALAIAICHSHNVAQILQQDTDEHR